MNIKQSFLKITKYLFYVIAGIQIILGLLYVCANLFEAQFLQGSYEYIDVSKTLVTDEYIGILYPLLLRIPSYTIIYIIQLLAAGIALWFLTGVLIGDKTSKKSQIVVTFFLLSIPMLMQLHMTILPNSLAFSTVVVFLAFFLKRRSWKNALVMGVMTLIAALIMPDTIFVTGIITLLGVLLDLRKREVCWKEWMIWGLSIVIALSVGWAIQTPGSRGRIQKTFWAAMFQRTVSEYFSRSFMVWDDRVQTSFTIDEFMECAKRSDNMMYVAGPKLESIWGKEVANDLYKSMTMDCLRIRTRQVVYQIRDDLVDSALMPFSVLWQGNTRRVSVTGSNYDGFRRNWPEVSIYYFNYGVYGTILLLIVKLLSICIKRHKLSGKLGLLLCASLIQVIIGVMSTGSAVDYTGLWLMILWWGLIESLWLFNSFER